MTLFFGLFDQPNGILLDDYSPRAQRMGFGSDRHGFSHLTCFVPMSIQESFRIYDRPGLPHVLVAGYGGAAWEGRLEDVSIVNGGVRLGAFGYWRAMYDAPYTALWSRTSVADWFMLDSRQVGGAAMESPDRYQFDQNNRLYITPVKGAVHGNTSTQKPGGFGFVLPSTDRLIQSVSFDFDWLAPTNWYAQMVTWTAPYPVTGAWGSFGASYWNLIGNGSNQTGTVLADLSAAPRNAVEIKIYYNAADATYTPETGANYLKITNLRIKTTASSNVYADEIAKALVAYVNGINSAQLQSITALVESPALDLKDEVYEDAWPGDILDRLVGLGDNQTPPRQWECGVYENRLLHFRPRGSAGRMWYVDISALELQRTINALRNSAYATYKDTSGRALRTSVSADSDSIARYGLTRRGFVSSDTTSATQAGVHRDAFLADRKSPIPRVGIRFDRIFDASGAQWPVWMPRSGDTVVIRNLPPTLSTDIDRIRTFRIDSTWYDADRNTLRLTPESDLPSLESMLAREAAGV